MINTTGFWAEKKKISWKMLSAYLTYGCIVYNLKLLLKSYQCSTGAILDVLQVILPWEF